MIPAMMTRAAIALPPSLEPDEVASGGAAVAFPELSVGATPGAAPPVGVSVARLSTTLVALSAALLAYAAALLASSAALLAVSAALLADSAALVASSAAVVVVSEGGVAPSSGTQVAPAPLAPAWQV